MVSLSFDTLSMVTLSFFLLSMVLLYYWAFYNSNLFILFPSKIVQNCEFFFLLFFNSKYKRNLTVLNDFGRKKLKKLRL